MIIKNKKKIIFKKNNFKFEKNNKKDKIKKLKN
jgi:hypothetical protein